MIASWLAGFALYEWIAQTQGLGFWSHWLAQLAPAARRDRRLAAELRRRVRARACRRRPASLGSRRRCGRSASSDISRVTSSPARRRAIGGGPWHAGARAARRSAHDALLVAKCGERRPRALPAAPARARPAGCRSPTGGETTAFSFCYDDGGARTMHGRRDRRAVAARRTPRSRCFAASSGSTSRRSCAATSTPRRSSGSRAAGALLLDAQGLVRVRAARDRSRSTRTSTARCCGTSPMLKLAEEEAEAIGDLRRARRARRSLVTARAGWLAVVTRDGVEHVPARRRRRPIRRAPATRSRSRTLGARARRATRRRRPRGARPRSSRPCSRSASGDRRRRDGRRRRCSSTWRTRRCSARAPSCREVDAPSVAAAARRRGGAERRDDRRRRRPPAAARDLARRRRDVARGGRRPAGGLRGRDRRRRSRPDALRRRATGSTSRSNGGVFWRALAFELPDIVAVAWID